MKEYRELIKLEATSETGTDLLLVLLALYPIVGLWIWMYKLLQMN